MGKQQLDQYILRRKSSDGSSKSLWRGGTTGRRKRGETGKSGANRIGITMTGKRNRKSGVQMRDQVRRDHHHLAKRKLELGWTRKGRRN